MLLSDRDGDALAEIAGQLGADAVHAVADTTDSGQVKDAVALAVDRFGGLDIVFVDAGIFGDVAAIVDYPEDVFEQVLAVNVTGAFLVSKHALAVMRPAAA